MYLVSSEYSSVSSNADVVGEIEGEVSSQVEEVFNASVVYIHQRTLYNTIHVIILIMYMKVP